MPLKTKDFGLILGFYETFWNMDLVTHRNKKKKGDNVTLLSEGEEAENCLGCHGKLNIP